MGRNRLPAPFFRMRHPRASPVLPARLYFAHTGHQACARRRMGGAGGLTGEFPDVTVRAAGICPSSKQEPVWRAGHMFQPGAASSANPAIPLDTPAAMRPSFIASQRCRGIRGDGVGAYSKNAVRCTKMKTDKIVAIGLKQLKTVLCHCGITDGERPFRETLHTTEIETGTSRRIANGV